MQLSWNIRVSWQDHPERRLRILLRRREGLLLKLWLWLLKLRLRKALLRLLLLELRLRLTLLRLEAPLWL